jgi:hypothetical protein
MCAEHLEIGKGRLDDDEPLTWDELRSMKYTWAVIQETLRLEPTVLGGFRTALENIEFGGYTLLKGWRVSMVPVLYFALFWVLVFIFCGLLCHSPRCFHQFLMK